jgi:hypothetical protein
MHYNYDNALLIHYIRIYVSVTVFLFTNLWALTCHHCQSLQIVMRPLPGTNNWNVVLPVECLLQVP